MEEKIYALENAPKLGVLKSVYIGYCSLFKNLKQFIKFCYPVIPLLVICFIPALLDLTKSLSPIALLGAAFLLAIVGIACTCFGFWKFLQGIVAVSYFAKDIYENKPVQNFTTYFKYVQAHTKSYVKLWLQLCLASIVFAIGIVGLIFLSVLALRYIIQDPKVAIGVQTLVVTAIAIILVPLWIVLLSNIPAIFWAYNDKTYPLNSISESINAAYKHPFTLVGAVILINLPWAVAEQLFNFMAPPLLNNLYATSGMLVLGTLVFVISTYTFSYVYTRYHFEFIKK